MSAEPPEHGRSLPFGDGATISGRTYLAGMSIWLVVISLILFWRGGFVGPDTFLLFLLLVAVVLGQARTFLRDWIPFVVVFFGWMMLRDYADQAAEGAAFGLHDADLIAAERWLFGGEIPTAVLQRTLYTPGEVHWYDVVATAFWAMHFVLPLLFAFLLWTRDKSLYWRFVYALLALSFAGFATYVVFPAVPPWLASRWGSMPEHVHLIRADVLSQSGFGSGLSWLAENGNPNPVAAMPSLHAAYPTLVLIFCLFRWRSMAPLALLYCLGLWFSIVYIGDHYVVDVLAGIAYAVAAYLALEAVYRFAARRRRPRRVSRVGVLARLARRWSPRRWE